MKQLPTHVQLYSRPGVFFYVRGYFFGKVLLMDPDGNEFSVTLNEVRRS
jgi:hypothetical protein